MTKREEIREGIRQIAESADDQNEKDMGSWEHFKDLLTDSLLSYLHSQGVVIKVDGDDAGIEVIDSQTMKLKSPDQVILAMLDAGYAAVEPLIIED